MRSTCPKCGQSGWSKPKYRAEVWVDGVEGLAGRKIANECLVYECACGYKTTTPTADAKEKQ